MVVTIFFVLVILHANLLVFFSARIQAQINCLGNGNYTSNSAYANNLNTVLSPIPDRIDVTTGFYSASAGQAPDRANVIALCRGDVQPSVCRGCIQSTTSEVLTSCPNQRQVNAWSEFCMLRFSNETLYGINAPSPTWWFFSNPEYVTNSAQFLQDLGTLLDSLRDQAAEGGPRLKVAAGNSTATNFQYIFALVQCTPDLTAEDCRQCLIDAAQDIPTCCDGRTGATVLCPSCNIRYDTSPFYNLTRLQELQPQPPVAPAAAPPPAPAPPPPPPVAPQPPPPPPPPGGGNNTTTTVIIVVASVAASVLLAVLAGVLLQKRTKRKPKPVEGDQNDDISVTVESLKYSLSTIRSATNDFSDENKLGQGGFGAVYKGVLPNDQAIAVKRLSENSGQGDVEFKNEVVLLAKLQHRNLVRLLGFCLEGKEKLLVYEFVQNASLDQFIFDPVKRSYLDWEKRAKIIGGIARGILYLHEDSQLRIIHRDLKPTNVLLDGSMNPKIADFGMARLFEQDETQGNTSRITGTFGYMAPEYMMHGQFSVKSDVFSFGVLLLEIVSGMKNKRGDKIEYLLRFAWKNWKDNTCANLVDPCLRSGSGTISEKLRCIHIGLLCVQDKPADRPTMGSVVLMLNSSSMTLAAPAEPFDMVGDHYGSNTSVLEQHRLKVAKHKDSSKGGIPIQSDNSPRSDATSIMDDLYPS